MCNYKSSNNNIVIFPPFPSHFCPVILKLPQQGRSAGKGRLCMLLHRSFPIKNIFEIAVLILFKIALQRTCP